MDKVKKEALQDFVESVAMRGVGNSVTKFFRDRLIEKCMRDVKEVNTRESTRRANGGDAAIRQMLYG